MNRRSFFLSGLALAAFPLSCRRRDQGVRYNFQGRAWGEQAGEGPSAAKAGEPQQPSAAGGGAPQPRGSGRILSRGGGAAAPYGGKQIVPYQTTERPGTIIVNTGERHLYYVLGDGQAIRYGVGVGRQGFEWAGVARVAIKREWPEWRPPADMIQRELIQYGRQLPAVMEGGPGNPLGARALYLFQGSRDTLYRIHGTNEPRSIGTATSSGCIRMLNEEVIDLYDRVQHGGQGHRYLETCGPAGSGRRASRSLATAATSAASPHAWLWPHRSRLRWRRA
jgi:lipoprotein-anchoring transpeptidase ErfK/SrfK